MRAALLAAVLVLAGCKCAGDVRIEGIGTMSCGQRVRVHVMCPGAEFDGWYVYGDDGLHIQDDQGRRLNNQSRCAWLSTNPTPSQGTEP